MKKDPHPKWPEAPQSLAQRLMHTLDVHEGQGDDMRVLAATMGAYAPYGQRHSWTGITLGDLRAIADIMINHTYTLADHNLACQFSDTGDSGPRACSRCKAPLKDYEGSDCPQWEKALGR